MTYSAIVAPVVLALSMMALVADHGPSGLILVAALACVLASLLAVAPLTGLELGGRATAPPSPPDGVMRQRDPDAPGRVRPRAPTANPLAA